MDLKLGSQYYFAPKDDMTPIESARFAELFSFAIAAKGGVKWLEFIDNNKLERHFYKGIIGDDIPQ
jgi:hypothetical protein